MDGPEGRLRLLLAGGLAFVLLALATLALTTMPREGRTPGSALGQQVEPAQEKPAPPDEGIRESHSTPIPEEQAFAIATANARRYTGPRHMGPALVHRASPTIENVGSNPLIFIATVEGKEPGLRLRRDVLRIYTPLRLGIERTLADEFDPPAGFRYVGYGGRTADGDEEAVAGMHPQLAVGKRYVFYTIPLTGDDGRYDPRFMTVNYAMPIDSDGQVEEIRPDGQRVRVALADLIPRIQKVAAEGRWAEETGRSFR